MQIPKQIYFKQTTPKGGKLIATIEGNDLPNIIQIKGTNDCSPVKRKRERVRALELTSGTRDWDDDRRNDNDDDDEDFRDEHGCHRNTVGVWESKNKYTTLKQTLIFMKKFRCKRIIQVASYDEQGKLIDETPASTIKDQSITFAEGIVEIKWTSVTEVQVREYRSEYKLPNSTIWEQFDSDPAIAPNTQYTAIDYPTVSGSITYRLSAVYNDNTEKELLSQPVNVTLNTNIAEVTGFLPSYDGTFMNITWSSSQESGLSHYNVERLDVNTPGAEFAVVIPDITQQGPSDYGPVQDVPGSGTFRYRLVAVYADGTSDVVATFPTDLTT